MSIRQSFLCVVGVFFVATIGLRCVVAGNNSNELRQQFITKYCFNCHSAVDNQSEFRIDTLSHDLTGHEAHNRWKIVLKYVTSGLMPPKEGKGPVNMPSDAKRDEFAVQLKADLDLASSQLVVERAPIRRLNRIEYLNSLRDLFGFRQIDLPNTFPDDHTNMAFDTMADGLHFSPSHLVAYLEVASDITSRVVPLPDQRRIKTCKNSQKNSEKPASQPDDAPLFSFSGVNISGQGGGYWDSIFRAPACGVYRVQIRAKAEGDVGADGRPLRLGFYALDPTRFYIPMRALRAELPNVGELVVSNLELETIECEISLEQGEAFQVFCDNRFPVGKFPDRGVDNRKLKEFTSAATIATEPTILLESMLVEGPVAPLPRQLEFLRNREPTGDESYLREVLLPLAERAYRRPLYDNETVALIKDVQQHLATGPSLVYGLHYGVRRILCSPDFLYRETLSGRRDNYTLASHLSYFLWSSLPDPELLRLAADGSLSQPEVLKEQRDGSLVGRIGRITQASLACTQVELNLPGEMVAWHFCLILSICRFTETYQLLMVAKSSENTEDGIQLSSPIFQNKVPCRDRDVGILCTRLWTLAPGNSAGVGGR